MKRISPIIFNVLMMLSVLSLSAHVFAETSNAHKKAQNSAKTKQTTQLNPSSEETFSDADMERKYLSMLVNELDGLDYLIKKAEHSVDYDERVKFQYQWLKRDLAIMKSGIKQHILSPTTLPRRVSALAGDYRK